MTMLRRHIFGQVYRRWSAWALLLFLGMGVIIGLGSRPVHAQEGGPVGKAYRGRAIFSQRCVECHGPQGRGDGRMASQMPVPLPDFTDPAFVADRSPQQVFDVISKGRMENLMPPWESALSEEERWDVTAYVWSLHVDAADLAQGEQTYAESCASCHGADGAGVDANTPDLRDAKWLQMSESQWRAAVQAPEHPPIGDLSQAETLQAATFARSFSLGFAIDSPDLEGDGVVLVRVTNATKGEPLGGATASLFIFDGSGFFTTREAETDDEGVARFEGLSTDSIWAFAAQTTYNDALFTSEVAQFQPDQAQLEIVLPVYEPGASVEDVRVRRAHWFVTINSAESIEVGELHVLENTSNRVYMGEEGENGREVLVFHLPVGAFNVGVEGAETPGRFRITDDAIIDAMPLTPGQRQVLFRYSLPVQDGVVVMTHSFEYPIDNLNLLIPDVGLDVQVDGWTEEEPLQTEGGAFLNYSISALPAGSAPPVTLAGVSSAALARNFPAETQTEAGRQVIDRNATPGISGQPYAPWAVAGLSVVVLVGGVVLAMRRRRALLETEPKRRQQWREALIEEIAALDVAYEAGEVPEAEYQAERALLKAKLSALSQDMGDNR